MPLRPHHQTIILSVASQVPIVLLLVIFFRIPDMPILYRVMAVVTVVVEAALLSELIGNIVQKVRPEERGIIIRGVLERKRLPWARVKGLRQVVLSPMRGGTRLPAKLVVVRTDDDEGLSSADRWWEKRGPLASGRTGMAGLVSRYDAFVSRRLRGWSLLWVIEYRRPQSSSDAVEVEYLAMDGRERALLDALKRFRRGAIPLLDLTYPSFVRSHGGKYSSDVSHVWETVE